MMDDWRGLDLRYWSKEVWKAGGSISYDPLGEVDPLLGDPSCDGGSIVTWVREGQIEET